MRNYNFTVLLFLILISLQCNGQIGIGTTNINQSAALQINDTAKGILIPRMNNTQMLNISGINGLLIYNITTNSFWYYAVNTWVELLPDMRTIELEVSKCNGTPQRDFILCVDTSRNNNRKVYLSFDGSWIQLK